MRSVRKSFTLIELFFVIAILAILAGIIMGPLRKSRVRGRKVLCLNNLKQLTHAALYYTIDHQDRLPATISKAFQDYLADTYLADVRDSRPGDESIVDRIPFFSLQEAEAVTGVPGYPTLWKYYDENIEVTRCPEVRGYLIDPTPVWSYGVNALVASQKLASVQLPPQTILLVDCTTTLSDPQYVTTFNDLAFRHLDQVNVSFIDMHVGSYDESFMQENRTKGAGKNLYDGSDYTGTNYPSAYDPADADRIGQNPLFVP